MKKALICFLALAILPLYQFAQTEGSTFTATGRGCATTFVMDYQSNGINPANLGWDYKFADKKFSMGLSEFAYSIHSQALTKNELRGTLRQAIEGKYEDLTYQQKIDAAREFSNAGLALNVDVGLFGFAFMHKKAGGFALRISDRMQYYSKLGQTASDLLFLGKTSNYFDSLTIVNSLGDTSNIANYANMNPDSVKMVLSGYTNAPKIISKIMNGSELTYSWVREYNFSYGRRVFGDSMFALYAGVGIKYFQGLAMLNIKSENDKMTAFSSLSPIFNIDYGKAAAKTNEVVQSGALPKTVGNGFGFDFGVNVLIANRLKIGASLINMGSIRWKGNVYTIKDTFLYNTTNPGLDNYNIPAQLKDIMGKDGLLELVGEKERTVQLPGMVRAGASFRFSTIAEIGIDAVIPVNQVAGGYEKAIISIGGDLTPLKWLKLQAGFVYGGNYDAQIPLGIMFVTPDGTWETGVASRDAITFFTQNGPTLSLAFGFLRFRF